MLESVVMFIVATRHVWRFLARFIGVMAVFVLALGLRLDRAEGRVERVSHMSFNFVDYLPGWLGSIVPQSPAGWGFWLMALGLGIYGEFVFKQIKIGF